jgi:hypothetical protein
MIPDTSESAPSRGRELAAVSSEGGPQTDDLAGLLLSPSFELQRAGYIHLGPLDIQLSTTCIVVSKTTRPGLPRLVQQILFRLSSMIVSPAQARGILASVLS